MAVNLAAPLFLAQGFAAQAPARALRSSMCSTSACSSRRRASSPILWPRARSTRATTTLAQALAPRVRVNAVAPGPTLPSPRQSEAEFAQQAAALPLQRGPTPEDIAAAVVYLAQARSVTGVTIAVDGGQHLSWRTADSEMAE